MPKTDGSDSSSASTFTPDPSYDFILRWHKWIDDQVPDGTIVFLGDSITQGMFLPDIAPLAANFGICGDTTDGLLYRLPTYKSVDRASVIVLQIGINDIEPKNNRYIIKNIRSIIQSLPPKKPLVVNALFPVDEKAGFDKFYNPRTQEINKALRTMCDSRPNTLFVDPRAQMLDSSGQLKTNMHVGDGIHLSPDGYRVWKQLLKEAISQINPAVSTK